MTWTHCLLLSVVLATSAAPAFSVSVQPGWPQTTGDKVCSSPALGDLDGDGELEVVVGSRDGKVYAWHDDGSPVTGWPQSTGYWVDSSPVVGDLDGDGELEVVVGSLDNSVYAWHHDGTPVTGWPQTTGNLVGSSPSLGDLDGDGELEVVVGSRDHRVYAWDQDGSPVTGWPRITGGAVDGSPALGDLDGDGDPEVVVGSWNSKVYAWHHDGSPVTGWPQTVGDTIYSSPALGNLDGDDDLEVVLASYDGSVYAWHHDGTPVVGWPRATGGAVSLSCPVLGDLDGDGDLEVLIGSCDNKVHAWHHDGTLLTGWPQTTANWVTGSPALADLDGDDDLEVVVGSCDSEVYAWHHDGTAVAGWPQTTGGVVESSPAIGDLDGDGDVEVVVGSDDYKVHAWSCDTPTDDLLPWPMFRHDALHTGLYRMRPGSHFVASPSVGAVPLDVTFTDRSTDNPTSWSWDFGDGTTSTQQNPTHDYTAVGRYTVSLTAVTDLGTDTETKQRCIAVLFPDVLTNHWAWSQVISCVDANIVKGYDDGLYHPEYPVTRDQMAVYISRALVSPSGDAAIPDPEPPPSFSDVSPTHWAYKHIEYAVSQNVVKGYADGTYLPGVTVDRGTMAVYVARAMVAPGGDAAIPDPVPPATFPDVPDTYWSYKQVEYCVGQGVVKGYDDGLYHPERVVTRDQMAVYIARAFGLL